MRWPLLASAALLLLHVAPVHGYWKEPGERQLEILRRQVTIAADGSSAEPKRAVAVLAAGCFWGVELAFTRLPGVLQTEVGYTGGHLTNPGYEQVSRGSTMHAEAVRVTYDASILSYEDLLAVFFDAHDPTQKNRQGNDIGTRALRGLDPPTHLLTADASTLDAAEYRSAIFVVDDEERAAAEAAVKKEAGRLGKHVATTVEPFSTFYAGEDYHQAYLAKRGQTAAKGAVEPIRCYG